MQVCGLKWSPDDREIASGGNDNQLFVWGVHSTSPLLRFQDHSAAVKAIAWSPHQHGLLASGGGTADRCIRFWNTATASALNCIDTGGCLELACSSIELAGTIFHLMKLNLTLMKWSCGLGVRVGGEQFNHLGFFLVAIAIILELVTCWMLLVSWEWVTKISQQILFNHCRR